MDRADTPISCYSIKHLTLEKQSSLAAILCIANISLEVLSLDMVLLSSLWSTLYACVFQHSYNLLMHELSPIPPKSQDT